MSNRVTILNTVMNEYIRRNLEVTNTAVEMRHNRSS